MKPSTPSSTAIIDPFSLPWSQLVTEFTKDMHMIGWSVDASSINGLESLHQLIKEKLKINPNEITALFYRMGIEENRVGIALANKHVIEAIDEIGMLIIKRSSERIISRSHYSL